MLFKELKKGYAENLIVKTLFPDSLRRKKQDDWKGARYEGNRERKRLRRIAKKPIHGLW